MMRYTEFDAVADVDPMAFRRLLKTLDDGLGSEDCHKLSFLAADFDIPKTKMERVRQATDIFEELEKLSLIAAADIGLLWELMELIHRKDLQKKIDLYATSQCIKGSSTNAISQYRLLLLKIADNTSSSELESLKKGCRDILGRQAVSKIKDVFQLFSLLEERGALAKTHLGFLRELLKLADNVQMMEEIDKYENQGSLPDIELAGLSSSLSSEWKKLGTYLGLSYYRIQGIDGDYRLTEQKAQQMLYTWRQGLSSKDNAYGILSEALKKCHRMDLAKQVNDMAVAHMHSRSVRAPPYQTRVFQPTHSDEQYQPPGFSMTQQHLMMPSDFYSSAKPQKPDDHGLPDLILQELSEHIVADWQKLGTFLELDHSTLRRIDQDHRLSEDKALSMLMTWRSRLSSHTDAVKTLASVLKVVGRVDLSERLQGITSPLAPMAAQLQQLGDPSEPQPMIVETTDPNQPVSHIDGLAMQGKSPPSATVNVQVGPGRLAEQMRAMGLTQPQQEQVTSVEITMSPPNQGIMVPRHQQESLPEYPMWRNPRGLCMIINNKMFDGRSPRSGSELDTGKLHNLFQKLHFQVEVKENLKANEMFTWFKEVSQVDHSNYDCFACCIMTHGDLGNVYGSDNKQVEIQEILGLFKGISCQSLAAKPKMFFIQACQGTVHQEGVVIETDEPRPLGMGAGIAKTLPNEADFLLSLATVPGYVSYRSASSGSWYVNALVDEITKHHDHLNMMSILTKVNNTLSEALAKIKGGKKKQIPAPSFTLRKELYLRSLPQ